MERDLSQNNITGRSFGKKGYENLQKCLDRPSFKIAVSKRVGISGIVWIWGIFQNLSIHK